MWENEERTRVSIFWPHISPAALVPGLMWRHFLGDLLAPVCPPLQLGLSRGLSDLARIPQPILALPVKPPLESNFNGVIPRIFVDLEKLFEAAFIEKTISLHFGIVIQ